jgi:hypothetical protein
MYWVSIAKIPKGILHKIRKLCFQFLWVGNAEKISYSSIKWSKLAMPKELGGWGIKNLVWLFRALAAKSMWRSIQNDMLWSRVMSYKYILGMSSIDWIWLPWKSTQNNSICWKDLVEPFPLIGNHLV